MKSYGTFCGYAIWREGNKWTAIKGEHKLQVNSQSERVFPALEDLINLVYARTYPTSRA